MTEPYESTTRIWDADYNLIGWVDRDGIMHVNKPATAGQPDPMARTLDSMRVIVQQLTDLGLMTD